MFKEVADLIQGLDEFGVHDNLHPLIMNDILDLYRLSSYWKPGFCSGSFYIGRDSVSMSSLFQYEMSLKKGLVSNMK